MLPVSGMEKFKRTVWFGIGREAISTVTWSLLKSTFNLETCQSMLLPFGLEGSHPAQGCTTNGSAAQSFTPSAKIHCESIRRLRRHRQRRRQACLFGGDRLRQRIVVFCDAQPADGCAPLFSRDRRGAAKRGF